MKKHLYATMLLAGISAAPAHAVVVVSGSGTLTTTDSTQQGRVSRDGTPSVWSAQSAYPGTLNATTAYRYDLINGTFAANANQAIYYEITFSALDAAVSQPFSVAYRNSFNPVSIAANYLGDSGVSAGGENAGIPIVYQVIVTAGGSLLVNFSEVTTGLLPTAYTYSISAFSDANRNENFGSSIPEPATWAMLIGGFGLVGGTMRRRAARIAFA